MSSPHKGTDTSVSISEKQDSIKDISPKEEYKTKSPSAKKSRFGNYQYPLQEVEESERSRKEGYLN